MEPPNQLRIGLLLPSREVLLGGDLDARRLTALAAEAEQRGYDSVWVGDSPLARPRLDPMAVLSAVAASTESVELGTAALVGILRHPIAAAWQIASVDQLSRGRLIVGLGAGFPSPATRAELGVFGVPFERRLDRLVDTVSLWRALWSPARWDGAISVGEQRWTFEDVAALPRPFRNGGPPLWLAADGDRTRPLIAAEHFDGWLPYSPEPEAFAAGWAHIASHTAAGEEGRSPTAALYVTVLADDDTEAGRAELDRYCAAYYGVPLDAMETRQAFRTGPIETIVSSLAEYVDAGARHLVLRVGSLCPERHLDALDDIITQLRRKFA